MQGLVSRATIRHASSPLRRASGTSSTSQLLADVAGDLAAIPASTCRQARITELHGLRTRYGAALTERWHALQGAGDGGDAHEADHTLASCRWIGALHVVLNDAPRLLEKYLPDQCSGESPVMRPAAAQTLQVESVDTVRWLLAQEAIGRHLAATYAAALDPTLRPTFLGEHGRDASLRRMIDHLASGADWVHLSEPEILALRLYAHPDSGAFNLLRAWAELRALSPHQPVARCVQEIPELVCRAVRALHKVPSARVRGTLYKGLISRAAPRWKVGETLPLDRPLSVTALARESYAGRVVRGALYDRELHMTDSPGLRTQAVTIAPFHPVATAHQAEVVILPGQIYRIQGCEVRSEPAREGGSHTIERFTAHKIGEAQETGQAPGAS